MSENSTLSYIHQDHLTGTSLMTDSGGSQIDTTMKYYPYGGTREGSVPTDRLFTGQRLDGIGLYYYGARYYDPLIGRFISPDTIVPDPASPQSFNRYSYCLNNPLKYTDPSGNYCEAADLWEKALHDLEEHNSDTEPQFPLEINSFVPISEQQINNMNLPEDMKQILLDQLSKNAGIYAPAIGISGGIIETIGSTLLGKITGLVGMIIGLLLLKGDTNPDINQARQDKVRDDIQKHPEKWEKTGEKSEPAVGKNYKGGTSTEETFRNKETGQVVQKHTITDRNGIVVHEHFRYK